MNCGRVHEAQTIVVEHDNAQEAMGKEGPRDCVDQSSSTTEHKGLWSTKVQTTQSARDYGQTTVRAGQRARDCERPKLTQRNAHRIMGA